MNKIEIYHIYLKEKCIYHSLSENEFKTTWSMIQNLMEVVGTKEVSKKDISFEKVYVDKEMVLNSSH